MKEKDLIKVAFTVAIVGILILFIISQEIRINDTLIENINKEKIGEMVKVNGKIVSLHETDTVVIFTVAQPSSMDVIVFKQDNKTTLLEEGQQVEIIGTIDDYEGKLEVIGEEIRVLE